MRKDFLTRYGEAGRNLSPDKSRPLFINPIVRMPFFMAAGKAGQVIAKRTWLSFPTLFKLTSMLIDNTDEYS